MTRADALERGRESFGRWAWGESYAQLSAADREAPLEPEDLERLATAAYLIGRDADSADILARAHNELGLIRFRGHCPKGGYDVQNGITQNGTTRAATVL